MAEITFSMEFFCYIQCYLFPPMIGGYCGENDLLKLSHRNPIVKTICFILYVLGHCSKYGNLLFIFKILVLY